MCFPDERDKAKFEDLHRSIRACDDILSSVESNLTNFRNDLAAVSADIESLQARSEALNVRLENRKAVEKGLGPLVEELSVSPLVITTIAEGHIDETWVKVLAEVDKRATAHKKNAQQPQNKALADVGPLLEKLILKVRIGLLFESAGSALIHISKGNRTNTGFPGCANQSIAVASHQCPNHSTPKFSPIQGSFRIPSKAPTYACRRDMSGLYEHHAVVLLEPVHPLQTIFG